MRISVAIIGAGFSGTLTAIQLARSSTNEFQVDIYLIDGRGVSGRGLAYSPPSDRFKLNVRAKAMGAFSEDVEGFYRWLKQRDPALAPDDFVSRRHYGDYISELLDQASSQSPTSAIHRISDEVIDAWPEAQSHSYTLSLKSGRSLTVDACVLAIGNVMQTSLGSETHPNSFRSPFEPQSYSDLASRDSILVIGSGLTAVDVIMEAEARGFKGSYTLLSRHGRLPRPHEDISPAVKADLPDDWDSRGSVRSLVAMIRAESRRLGSSQPVFDAMRPRIQSMWSNFSLQERRRFLRHARPFWDIHRHRVPAEHSRLLSRLESANRLHLIAGKLLTCENGTEQVAATIARKKPTTDTIRGAYDVTFLCVGPEGDLRRCDSALVKNLVARGLLTPGPLKLGTVGEPKTPHFWIVGPLQREERWEITAVREVRDEAKKVAHEIARTIFRSDSSDM